LPRATERRFTIPQLAHPDSYPAVDLGVWQDSYDKAAAFVSGLTNDEKIQIITGQDVASESSAWTAMVFLDGAVSPLNHFFVSAFPVSLAAAMTWDKDLMYKQYQAQAYEHWHIGTQIINGPCDQPMGRVYWGGVSVCRATHSGTPSSSYMS
jgi:hypothetical protein